MVAEAEDMVVVLRNTEEGMVVVDMANHEEDTIVVHHVEVAVEEVIAVAVAVVDMEQDHLEEVIEV